MYRAGSPAQGREICEVRPTAVGPRAGEEDGKRRTWEWEPRRPSGVPVSRKSLGVVRPDLGDGGRELRPSQLQVWNPVGRVWQGSIARAPAEKPGGAALPPPLPI